MPGPEPECQRKGAFASRAVCSPISPASLRDGDDAVTIRSVCPASKDEPPSLDIERGRSRSRVLGAPAGEFRPAPPVNGKSNLVLDARELARVVDSVIHAAGKDESRPVLTGTLLEYKPGQLRLVAADGFRLAIAKSTTATGNDANIDAIIPASTMRIVADAVRNRSGTVDLELALDQGRAQFKIPNLTVITHLLLGSFPHYRQLVPDRYAAQALVDRDELRRAVDICAVFARSGSNIIRLVSHGDELQMFSRSEEVGDHGSRHTRRNDRACADCVQLPLSDGHRQRPRLRPHRH